MMKKKCEITGEIKTTGKPSSIGNIKLGPTFPSKTLHVTNRSLKRLCVRGFTIANSAEINDRLDNFSGRNVVEETGAGCGIDEGGLWLLGEEDGEREERAGGELKREDGEEGEEEKQD